MSKNVLLLDGHGKIGLRLTRIIAPKHKVTSIIQNAEHEEEVKTAGATPVLLTLSTASVADLTKVFEGKDVVYLIVGCGQQPEEEIYKTTYYDFSIKVYDAIEAVSGSKPRLIVLTGVDVRDLTKPMPAHYTEEDIKMSTQLREWIPHYMKWKYEGNKVLAERTKFKWTMLRGGGFEEKEGTGKAAIGRTGLCTMISRDDIAAALALLVDRDDAHGLSLDIVGGETPIGEALDAAIKKGETDFVV